MAVAVTGIGMVNGLGASCDEVWRNLLAQRSSLFLSDLGLIAPVGLSTALGVCRVEQFLEMAVREAIVSANLTLPLTDCAVVIGSSRGYQREWELLLNKQIGLEQWSALLIGNLASRVCGWIGSEGISKTISAACASGNWAIALGYELIESGRAQRVLVGAVDAAITPLTMAGFAQLGVLAKHGVFPFSRERGGLGVGEGGGVMILERSGTPRYGKVLGVAMTNDASHITAADQSLTAIQRAIVQCLRSGGLHPEQVQYINAHGTATLKNDRTEASAIEQLFPHQPFVSSSKGAIGHCLGAGGMMEAIFCLLAIRNQQLPPSVGLKTPAFNLNLVRETIVYPLKTALNLSFGFGGQNTVIALG